MERMLRSSSSNLTQAPLNREETDSRDGDLTDYDSDGDGAESVGRFDSINRNRPLSL